MTASLPPMARVRRWRVSVDVTDPAGVDEVFVVWERRGKDRRRKKKGGGAGERICERNHVNVRVARRKGGAV